MRFNTKNAGCAIINVFSDNIRADALDCADSGGNGTERYEYIYQVATNYIELDSRSPRDDDHARLPREDRQDRQDQLHQEEEVIRELDPPQDWSQELILRGIYRQPIYEQAHRAQLPERQVRYQRAPEPPAVHAPFNFDVRDEATLRYWIRHHESLTRALREYGWNMGFRI
ncbi:hypothetical protein B9Z55_008880 [Caenorhabditis nigoni]|uniref:Uncharacterized protein n=1 Tax=Caenorhabditis nigoni TaxID=1611254 RepID=A0A2G5UPP5_9PELO|nr:hypothetical protein B9Z55_008880 [Caenorhabditis nigoni]